MMKPAATEEEISGARAYEALHVPSLFQQWCPHLLDSARISNGDRVLDVACGTAVLARAAVGRVGNAGHVAGIDIAPGMLAVARELESGAEWRQAPAEAVPFDDAAFDAVVSQFGLMFFANRVQALREMRRVVRPGGRVAVAVWDALDASPPYRTEVALLDRLIGREAGDALRAPFVLGDTTRLSQLFEAAGWSELDISTVTETACFPSVRIMIEADLRGWLPMCGVNPSEDQVQEVLAEAEVTLADYVDDEGRASFAVHAHIVSAKKR